MSPYLTRIRERRSPAARWFIFNAASLADARRLPWASVPMPISLHWAPVTDNSHACPTRRSYGCWTLRSSS